jgi:hypothetical protein
MMQPTITRYSTFVVSPFSETKNRLIVFMIQPRILARVERGRGHNTGKGSVVRNSGESNSSRHKAEDPGAPRAAEVAA